MNVPVLRPWPRDSRYVVSDAGPITGPSGRVLAVFPDRDGYLRFNTYSAGPPKKWAQFMVHVAVCETFHGPRPPGLVVRHGDGVKINVAATNLRWGTYEENEADKIDHDVRAWGVRHGMHKLTEDDVRAVRASFESHAEMSRRYGVSPDHIMHIRQGRFWRHI